MSAPAAIEVDAQYRQLREECGYLDRSQRGKIAVRGADAADYLEGQLTNEIERLEPGAGCYSALLDRKGHMQADMRVLRLAADEVVLDTELVAREAALRHLRTYSVGREVEIEDLTEELSIVAVLGPRSAEVAGVTPGPPHSHQVIEIGAVPCRAIATAAGIDLLFAPTDGERLRSGLAEGGGAEVSEQAAEIVRVEAGVPRFGAEMTTETMPAEAGIVEDAVSFTKGCYIGQETVARLHYRGKPNRHLRGLRFSAPAQAGEPLRGEARELGEIGTAVISPAFGAIGLAIIRREAEIGDALMVGDGQLTAEVTGLPFREDR